MDGKKITGLSGVEAQTRAKKQRGARSAWTAALLIVLALLAAGLANGSAAARGQPRRAQGDGTPDVQTQAAGAFATLTAIAPTLTAAAQQIQEGQNLVESLQLAAAANGVLQQNGSNPETVALLAIRGLNAAYSTQADAPLGQALDRLYTRQIFTGHSNVVTSVAFSPDGRTIVTGSWDSTARLWDARTGAEARQFTGNTGYVNSVAFSPDGRYILTGTLYSVAQMWDVSSGVEVRQFTISAGEVSSVAFSPKGQYVLTGDSGGGGVVRLWDASTGAEVRHFTAGQVLGLAFSPDGRYVVAGGGSVHMWDASTGAEVRQFGAHVTSVVFSPDGRYLLTGDWDKAARLWDASTGTEVRQFVGHTAAVRSVAFSPDGQYILTGSDDTMARLWDASTGTEVRQFVGHTDTIDSVAFSPDGRTVLTGSSDSTARLWDADPKEEPRRFVGHTGPVTGVAFSPDGRFVLSGSSDSTARLWDASTGAEVRRFTGHFGPVYSVAFSPDGRFVLTGSSDGTARLWDVSTGAEVRRFTAGGVYGVAFSPDGRYVLTGNADRTAYLWDASTGEQLRRVTGGDGAVLSVAFSPDGRTFAAGSDDFDNTARLWDANTETALWKLPIETGAVWAVAFSPDGRYLLTSSDRARLWDASTGAEVRRFPRGGGPVAYSPDGRSILTGANGGAAIWDVSTGEQQRQFSDPSGVVSVAFSPDGRSVVTGSYDGTAHLWDTDYHGFIAYACTRVFRDLTPDEREQYGIPDSTPTCPQFGAAASLPTGTPIATRPIPVWTSIPTLGPTNGPTPTVTATLNPTLAIVAAGTLEASTPVFGPSSGHLDHNREADRYPIGATAGVVVTNFIAEARFDNPYDAVRGRWDYGFFFFASGGHEYRLIIYSNRNWGVDLYNGEFTHIAHGTASNLDISAGGSNVLGLAVSSGQGFFRVNGVLAAVFDVSTPPLAGDVEIVTGAFPGDEITGETTRYHDFTIWSIGPAPTLTPTATPSNRQTAQVGSNAGEIDIGGGQVWNYAGRAGELLTIHVNAAHPANQASDRTGLLDTRVILHAPDGSVLAENDDIPDPVITDSLISAFPLPADGLYTIEVRSYADMTGGAYTLVIETASAASPTLTASPTMTASLTPTPG